MLRKRLISCLDVRNGHLAKSIQFLDTKEIGNAVEAAERYYNDGIDELVFYDINASHEGRDMDLELVQRVASRIFIPFSVGGGLNTIEGCNRVRLAGAEKINVNSAAVKDPSLITKIADALGSQCAVLSMDVKEVSQTPDIPSGYEIVTHGGRSPTGLDAIEWAKRGAALGAGEIVVNSIDADGTKQGFHIPLTRAIAQAVDVPVIASGGGGSAQHIYEVLTEGQADAALVSSILHYGETTIGDIKAYLRERGVAMR